MSATVHCHERRSGSAGPVCSATVRNTIEAAPQEIQYWEMLNVIFENDFLRRTSPINAASACASIAGTGPNRSISANANVVDATIDSTPVDLATLIGLISHRHTSTANSTMCCHRSTTSSSK